MSEYEYSNFLTYCDSLVLVHCRRIFVQYSVELFIVMLAITLFLLTSTSSSTSYNNIVVPEVKVETEMFQKPLTH